MKKLAIIAAVLLLVSMAFMSCTQKYCYEVDYSYLGTYCYEVDVDFTETLTYEAAGYDAGACPSSCDYTYNYAY